MQKKVGKKSGSGPDPVDEKAFICGLKGLNSAIVDFDTLQLDDSLLVVAAQ